MNETLNPNECLQVFVRCRPLLSSEMLLPVPVEVHPEVNKIIVRDVGCNKNAVKTFSFDKVFGPEAEQDVVYNNVAAPLIQEVLMGFNCTILAYGQTGTGKTFTIEGDRNAALNSTTKYSQAGIIPRSMEHIFVELAKQEFDFEVGVSFLELYNEEIFDLLSKAEDLTKLKLYDSSKGSVRVQGLEIRNVSSMKDVYDVLDKGCKKRRKAATLLNKMSSRSHTLFTVNVKMRERSTTIEKIKTGKLNLVDLAGSENIGRSGAVEKRAREAGNINQSLLALGRVITALCENAIHIPYRESKLTRLLRDSLGGQTKTSVIATISPSLFHLDETLNTLEYALRAKNIMNKPEVNAQVSATALTKDYLEKICLLEEQIQELSSEENFQVDPDNLKNLEAAITTKSRELREEIEIREKLMAESQELDNLILKQRETLHLQKLELQKYVSDQVEIAEKMAKEQEEICSEEKELQILEPVMSKMHETLHKVLKEKKEITDEVKKMEEITSVVVNENSRLQKQFSSMFKAHRKFNETLLEFKSQLVSSINEMQTSAMCEKSECDKHLSSLDSGFGSFIESSEKLCQQFGNIMNDVEKLKNIFQDALNNALKDEEMKARECHSNIESKISSFISCNFDPLEPLLTNYKGNLRNLFESFALWRDTLLQKLTGQENLLNNYLSTEDKNLCLLMDSCNNATQKQKEFIQEYTDVISSALSEESERKTKFEGKINALEVALEQMEFFLTRNLDNDINKSNLVHEKFRKYADGEMCNAKSLIAFCESSMESTNHFAQEMSFSSSQTLENTMKDMRESANISLANYQELLPNFSNCIHQTKASDESMKALEQRIADDKSRRMEMPNITSSLQKFKDNLMVKDQNCETLYRDHQAALKSLETNQATAIKEALDSFNHLHKNFIQGIFENVSVIEKSDTSGFSWKENIIKDDDDDLNTTLMSGEEASNPEKTSVLDETFTLSEESANNQNDTDCMFCISKDETMATTSVSLPVPVAKPRKGSVSKGSKQGKNKKVKQFDLVEKWCKELFDGDIDDKSTESDRSDSTA